MLVTIKTLHQETFQLEIDPQETVEALKLKIEAEKGEKYSADHQRLIYAGKFLVNHNKIVSYKIDEKKFIVIMLTQPQAPIVQASSSSGPEARESASTEGGGSKDMPAAEEPPTAANAGEPENAAEEPDAVAAIDLDFQSNVQSIMAMGYDEQQIEQALCATFHNGCCRAMEYSMPYIPEPSFQQQDVVQVFGKEVLEFLSAIPQIQQMRGLIQQNTNVLVAVLELIEQINPALLPFITENQAAFVRYLSEPDDPTYGAAAAVGYGAAPAPQAQPPNPPPLTQQDHEAIERLQTLGFSEDVVIDAYISFDRDENMAGLFLTCLSFDK